MVEDGKEKKSKERLYSRKERDMAVYLMAALSTITSLGAYKFLSLKPQQQAEKMYTITENALLQAKENMLDLRKPADAQKFSQIIIGNFEANHIHINKEKTDQFLQAFKELYKATDTPSISNVQISDTAKALSGKGNLKE